MPPLPIDIETVRADVVVVGGGGAASRAALSARLAGADVRLVTKAPLQSGGSTVHGASEIMSMGAAGFGSTNDSPQLHYEDTMRAGRGFIDPALVRVLAEDAPKRIRDLIALDVPLDRREDGQYKLIRSDFGSYARALGVGGRTGRAFVSALSDELLRVGVAVDAPVMLIDLLRDNAGEIAGVVGYDAARRTLIQYEAPSVILGTGGMHGAFEQQVSTPEMTGDGQAICFRHGAEMVNLEFHQFGCALVRPYVQLFSGSCFSLYPKLLNAEAEEFLSKYVPADVDLHEVYEEKVFPFTTTNPSRYIEISIARELAAGRGTDRGTIFFSFAHQTLERMKAAMPNTLRWMEEKGIAPQSDKLEVGVAFQCMNGGVRMVDDAAQSSIPGLYVIGELSGGVRGPDRPGGNSLAEGQVFGHRSGVAAAARAQAHRTAPATLEKTIETVSRVLEERQHAPFPIEERAAAIRGLMQQHCLVEKSKQGLDSALEAIEAIQQEIEADLSAAPETFVAALSLRNMAQASALVLRACENRRETRSAHYRIDYPENGGKQQEVSYILQKDGDSTAIRPHAYD